MLNKILWVLIKRMQLQWKIPNLKIHWSAFADEKSTFYGYNSTGQRCRVNKSKIGRFSYISADTKITRTQLGAFCSIGQECIIGGLAKHPTNWLSTHPAFFSTRKQAGVSFSKTDQFQEQSEVIIGNDVWIGARTMILDGCKIGDGSIIAAGAVVVKDIPPYAIVGGVPSKIIKFRFSENEIAEILNSKWWTRSIEELNTTKATPPFIDQLREIN